MNCHQKHERSWQVNENQLPVCTRCWHFFGLFMGGVIFSKRGCNRWTVRDTCLSLSKRCCTVFMLRISARCWLACGMLLCLPLIADGFLQLLTSYESTNLKRVLTGIPFGLGLGVLMCSMFSARAEAFVGAASLVAGNASFTLVRKSDQESE